MCGWARPSAPSPRASAVRDALERAGVADRPLWISYTLDDRGTLPSGEPVADAVDAALDLGAEAIMFNCCQAETIAGAIRIAAARADGSAAVGGYANRFVTAHAGTGGANEQLSAFRDDLDPEQLLRVRRPLAGRGRHHGRRLLRHRARAHRAHRHPRRTALTAVHWFRRGRAPMR